MAAGDPDPATRRALAEQLSGARGAEVTAWLNQLAQDDDKEVRAEAYRGLIGRTDSEMVARFEEGAQDPDYVVATIALSGLALAGDATGSEAISTYRTPTVVTSGVVILNGSCSARRSITTVLSVTALRPVIAQRSIYSMK